jgi:hypothetical protein
MFIRPQNKLNRSKADIGSTFVNYITMSEEIHIIDELVKQNGKLLNLLEKEAHHRHRHLEKRSIFTFQFSNYKISFMSNASLTVPSGTSVTGFNAPLDGSTPPVVLPDTAYKAGSCKYGVIAGPSGNPPGFTVAPGPAEEDFVVTENVPGAASDGIITFDAQDVNGNQLPQSQGTLIFTATTGGGTPVAVASQFNFDQPAAATPAALSAKRVAARTGAAV